MPPIQFKTTARSTTCHARLGRVTTPHGGFDTPAFMPVGTQAAIKGLAPNAVAATGARIILANTYHLMLRPGAALVRKMGGLHKWMRWQKPILTDSGGFQVFSLASINNITEDGVSFRSHLDGAPIDLTPESSMRIQNDLGADIIMAFDDCPPATSPDREGGGSKQSEYGSTTTDHRARITLAADRTARWLDRCVNAHARKHDQALFGIIQGGDDLDLRTRCVQQITQHDLPGYAIGGVAVGEAPDTIRRVVEHTAPQLPNDKPRYLMGLGYERDLLTAVRAGVDMFDCVLPTRNGRNANAFTSTGQMRLLNARYTDDDTVIEPGCDCTACAGGFTRSYLRHLFKAAEMLGPILVSAHNLRHFQRYMLDIRRAIAENDWSLIARAWPVTARDTPAPATPTG